jgi:hypothetical protein
MNNFTLTISKPYNVFTRTAGCTNSQRNGTLEEKSSGYYDTAPKEPTKQSIWREGSTVKWWDGKEWKAQSSGGITDFSTSVVFSSSSRLNVTWSAGAMNIGTATGLGTFAI